MFWYLAVCMQNKCINVDQLYVVSDLNMSYERLCKIGYTCVEVARLFRCDCPVASTCTCPPPVICPPTPIVTPQPCPSVPAPSQTPCYSVTETLITVPQTEVLSDSNNIDTNAVIIIMLAVQLLFQLAVVAYFAKRK